MSITKGRKLMLFVKDNETYKSLGFATNHTLNTNVSTVQTATKDNADVENGGGWQDNELDVFSYTITSENLFGLQGVKGMNAADVMDVYLAGQQIEFKFGLAETHTNVDDIPDTGWEQKTDFQYKGKGYITDLTVNAPVEGNATYNITVTGCGALEKVA